MAKIQRFIPKVGYTLMAQGIAASPADAQTDYFGAIYATGMATTAALARIYIPKAGTLKAAFVTSNNNGTLGTSEAGSISIRLNNTTDTLISNALTNDAAVTTVNNQTLAIALVAGDYVEIKWVTPTWATNPTTIRMSVVMYIE